MQLLTKKNKLCAIFAVFITSVGLFSPLAYSAEPPAKAQSEALDPYVTLKTQLPSEKNIVRFWFSFGCQYCAEYDKVLSKWGSTLPKEYRYIRSPILTSTPGSAEAAMAYYAALYTDKNKIDQFMSNAFELIHSKNMSPTLLSTYIVAAKMAGMNLQTMQKWYLSKEIKELVYNTALVSEKYQLQSTPTLGVSGRYTVTPEITAGNKEAFIKLMNGLVSMDIMDK